MLSAFLVDLKCRWLQSGLGNLEKHQTLVLEIHDYYPEINLV